MNELWSALQEHLGFAGVCAAVAAGLLLLARLAERVLPRKRRVRPAQRISVVGICAAIAAVLHIFDFPLPFLAPGFYKLDLSEVPVLMAGFYLGPSAAVACEAVKILLKLLLKGTSTAFVGDLANFVVGCSFVLPASIVYTAGKTRAWAVAALGLGTAVMTVFGSAFNAIYLLPKFAQLFGMSMDTILSMGASIHGGVHSVTTFVLLCVAPLNLVKGIAVSLLTLLLYKRVARPLLG